MIGGLTGRGEKVHPSDLMLIIPSVKGSTKIELIDNSVHNVIPKGMKEFKFGETIIYAINEKNAIKKFNKLQK